MKKSEIKSDCFSWDEKVSSRPNSRKIKEAFSHFDEIIETATELFDNIQSIIELDRDKLKKKKVNLQAYIKSCLDELGVNMLEYHITYSFDLGKKSNIEYFIDPDRFKNVISNFVRNSIEHGFTEDQEIKCIAFNISKTEHTNEIIIDLLDNGKGLPNDFNYNDFITFGISSQSSGSGIGGYLLDRTIRVHDGKIKYVSGDTGLLSIPSDNQYPFHDKSTNKASKFIKIKPGFHLQIILPLNI